MKKKDITALHAMDKKELMKVIVETQRSLGAYSVNRYSKQSKNVHEGTILRRKVAIASTILNEKELQHE